MIGFLEVLAGALALNLALWSFMIAAGVVNPAPLVAVGLLCFLLLALLSVFSLGSVSETSLPVSVRVDGVAKSSVQSPFSSVVGVSSATNLMTSPAPAPRFFLTGARTRGCVLRRATGV